jgi:hypothetical protein
LDLKILIPVFERFDRIISTGGVFLALGMLIIGMSRSSVLLIVAGLLILVSCTFWLYRGKNASLDIHLPWGRSSFTVLTILFALVYMASILLVYLRETVYQRPLAYFLSLVLIAGIIALQIFQSRDWHKYIILPEIVLLGINIAWSQLLIYPSIVGDDPWVHQVFSMGILDLQYIPEGVQYTNYPIFHLCIGITSLLSGLPYKYAAMFSVSFAQIVCNALFIFLLGIFLFSNHKVGLLGSLLLVLAPQHIYMSYWSIPNAFAAIFLIGIVYITLKFVKMKDNRLLLLLSLLMLALIATHTITALCMAIVLFVAWGAFAVYSGVYGRGEYTFPLLIPVLYTVGLVAWWVHDRWIVDVLQEMMREGFSANFYRQGMPSVGVPSLVTPFEYMLDNLAMYLFILISLIGILYMLKRDRTAFHLSVGLIGPAIFGFAAVSIILNLGIIAHRWYYFSEILLSLPLAVAVVLLGIGRSGRNRFVPFIPVLFIVVLTLFSVLSLDANVDNHLLSPNSTCRLTVTESELQALESFSNHWNGTIKADDMYAHTQARMGYSISSFSWELLSRDYSGLNTSLILVSEGILNKPVPTFYDTHRFDYDINGELDTYGFARPYDSGAVRGYLMI